MAQQKLFDVPVTGKPPSKKKPADIKINRVNRELARRRYYLHKQLDKNLFEISAAARRIKCKYASFEEIPVGPRYYVGQLIEFGYEVQFEMQRILDTARLKP